MTYKCAIVDDETGAINILSEFLKEVPSLELVKCSTSAPEMLVYLMENSVDLVFLDIHMPKLSGMEFIEQTKRLDHRPLIILATAHAEYAIQGFEQDVIDYLLKPFSFHRFLKSVQKALKLLERSDNKDTLSGFFFVKVDTKNKKVKINYRDIEFIEGAAHYVFIYLTVGRVMALLNMKDMEDQLPKPMFMRVHRSYIIPTSKIKVVDGNRIFLTQGNQPIALGNTYRFKVMEFLHRNTIS